ncbi:hypothetical protein HC776_01340 [bacterium]|nr:hypothetical protein [bacterium]
MRLLGRILAMVLVLVIPLLLMAASCNLALYNTMSSEQTYRTAFADRSLLDDIRPFAIPALFDAAGVQPDSYRGNLTLQKLISDIDIDNWQSIMEEAVSVTWMQERFDQLLRLFTGILANNYDTLDESVDVEAVKGQLQGDNGTQVAARILEFAPVCTAAQETQLAAFQATSQGDFPLCNTSDEALEAFSVSHVTGWLALLSDQMQSVTAGEFYNLNRTEARGLHVIVKLDEQISYVMYLCPTALLALIVFFTVRSFRSFGRWIGGTLLLSGIGVLAALVVMQIFFVNLLSEATQPMTETQRLFTQVIVSLTRAGMGGITQSMLLQAALMILAGFGLFALTALVGRNELVSTGTTVLVTEDGQVISSTSLPQIPTGTGSTSRQSGASAAPVSSATTPRDS